MHRLDELLAPTDVLLISDEVYEHMVFDGQQHQSAARFPGLTERQFRERPSTIYNLYQDAFGVSVVRTRERLRARTADADVAALLRLSRGAPLLEIRRIALGLADEPVELRLSRVNTARHEYYAELGDATA